MKTKEERKQIVEAASSLCSLDGYSKDKDLLQEELKS